MTWSVHAHRQQLLDNETGTIHKDPGGRLSVALAFPNTYYVGMSSLALQIIYRRFNDHPDVVCERVFWDKDGQRSGHPLLSLESGRHLADFSVWAFTISYEMDYFNVVDMLRQAGIPELARDRDESWPLLIAGGPGVTMNPEPIAPLFDAIVVGEGEEVVDDLIDLCRQLRHASRHECWGALDRIPGVYVPALVPSIAEQGVTSRTIQRLWVRELQRYRTISSLYTPNTEFGGMHLMEIARGCGRGCRFCLAGYVYRPPRQQPLDVLLAWAEEGMRQSKRIGLVSAAVSDYGRIDELATALSAMGAQISASSMRVDPISLPLIKAMRDSGAQTLTIAPEAGSSRLRNVINKTQTEDELLEAVELAQALDFPQLKLYFMIGHPTETQEDMEALVAFMHKVRTQFKRSLAINATPFVPKAHTPFQWQAMTDRKTIRKRQQFLQRQLGRLRIAVRSDSPSWAEVQGVLSRGDRRLVSVLLALPQLTVADFWQTMASQGLEKDEYLGSRQVGASQPWHIVQSGVSENYFHREWRLAERSQIGHHCPPDSSDCLSCQVCDPIWAFRELKRSSVALSLG